MIISKKDFIKKYYKYKKKYFKLKKSLKKNKKFMNNKQNFEIIENNGFQKFTKNGIDYEYYNQCFWISILDALKNFNINLTLFELRLLIKNNGITNINSHKEQFDTIEHFDSLLFIVNNFDLTINFYQVINNKIDNSPNYTIGNGNNIVNIASYGNHFAFIKSFGGNNNHNFNNLNIALGKEVTNTINYKNKCKIQNYITQITNLNLDNLNYKYILKSQTVDEIEFIEYNNKIKNNNNEKLNYQYLINQILNID